MPRTAIIDETSTDNIVHQDLTNGPSERACRAFVEDFEDEQHALSEILLKARLDCQPHIDRQKDIAKEAAEAGIEKRVFKAKLRERSHLRKAEAVTAPLTDRQKEGYGMGSMPLH